MSTLKTAQTAWWVWLFLMTCAFGRSLAQGEQYVGIGYNLLTANPDGGLVSKGGVDPGLLITRRVLDLSHSGQIETQGRKSCGQSHSISTVFGGKSYQDKLSLGVKLGGSVIAGIANAKFSLSPRFQRTKKETSQEYKVFQDETQVCNLGRVRFNEELSDWLNVSVTDSFASSVCGLPRTYSQREYMAFIDNWGTHMTTEVDIGTKVVQRMQTSLTEFIHHTAKASGADVSVGGSYKGFGASLGVNVSSFQSRESYSKTFGSHQETLTVGSESDPEPISVTLVSIDTVLKSKFWDVGSSLTSRGICDGNMNITVIAAYLLQALNKYAGYKLALPPTDPQLVVPLTWPRGTYGLPKAVSGCPSGRVKWHEGSRYFDNNYEESNNNAPKISQHLAGKWPIDGNMQMEFCIKGERVLSQFDVDWPAGDYCIVKYGVCPTGKWPIDGNMQMEFCIKGERVLSQFDVDWPAGDYCIVKYGVCPTGFQEGIILWTTANWGNRNSENGIMPDGIYNRHTLIMFCCRHDDVPTHSIFLPVDKPFYLLRHKRGCQHVHNMIMREEVAQWHEALDLGIVLFGFKLGIKKLGSHPYEDGYGSNTRLNFCYYSPIMDNVSSKAVIE
ncbi:hypothetical protein ACOMHN_054341 [Nucella lapillus]